jgi:hypothetical protein
MRECDLPPKWILRSPSETRGLTLCHLLNDKQLECTIFTTEIDRLEMVQFVI